jgi:anti-sigma regulatory factor (Ser/Thr protein kinase)
MPKTSAATFDRNRGGTSDAISIQQPAGAGGYNMHPARDDRSRVQPGVVYAEVGRWPAIAVTTSASTGTPVELGPAGTRPTADPDSVRRQHWFPGTVESIAQAREWVSEIAVATGHAPLAPTVELLVSELATNAVRYANGNRFSVEFDADGLLLIAVCDGNPTKPAPRQATIRDEGGRGLVIVEALSDRWGAEVHHSGKCVWFQLEEHAPLPEAPVLPHQ